MPVCHETALGLNVGYGVDRALVPTTPTGRNWDSTVGHEGQYMIIQGRRKPVAMSHLFQLSVAKTIHLSRKAVMSATGRTDSHACQSEGPLTE